jgi:hypothetical protein
MRDPKMICFRPHKSWIGLCPSAMLAPIISRIYLPSPASAFVPAPNTPLLTVPPRSPTPSYQSIAVLPHQTSFLQGQHPSLYSTSSLVWPRASYITFLSLFLATAGCGGDRIGCHGTCLAENVLIPKGAMLCSPLQMRSRHLPGLPEAGEAVIALWSHRSAL